MESCLERNAKYIVQFWIGKSALHDKFEKISKLLNDDDDDLPRLLNT